jgi:hypothetical protein
VSASLGTKIELGLEELSTVRDQLSPLICRSDDPNVGVIETASACAMLHSFYTEIEKILKLIAREDACASGRSISLAAGRQSTTAKAPIRLLRDIFYQ